MQVSTDRSMKFLSCGEVVKRETGERFYNLQVMDEEGAILRIFCNERQFNDLQACSFGQEISLAFRIYGREKGLGVSLVDMVV